LSAEWTGRSITDSSFSRIGEHRFVTLPCLPTLDGQADHPSSCWTSIDGGPETSRVISSVKPNPTPNPSRKPERSSPSPPPPSPPLRLRALANGLASDLPFPQWTSSRPSRYRTIRRSPPLPSFLLRIRLSRRRPRPILLQRPHLPRFRTLPEPFDDRHRSRVGSRDAMHGLGPDVVLPRPLGRRCEGWAQGWKGA
jgi:hypothetical protein